MPTTIKLKNGSGAPLAGDLVQGEPALDLTNKRLYTEDSGGSVIEVGTNPSTLTTSSADINGGTIDGVTIGGSSAGAGTFTTITGSGDMNIDSGTLFVDVSQNRVGVGTTSPDKTLHIVGPDGDGEGTPTTNPNCVAIFQNNGLSTDSSIVNIIAGSASTGNIAFGDADDDIRQRIVASMSDDSLAFHTGNNALAATFNSSGNLVFPNGQGIDFSASEGGGATGSILSDYEEGTFTPEIADANVGGNTGSASTAGFYTKIGRIVHLNFSLININTSGMTAGNSLIIRDLPFASKFNGTLSSLPSGSVYANLLNLGSTERNIVFDVPDGQSYGTFRTMRDDDAAATITVSDIASGNTDLRIAITYTV